MSYPFWNNFVDAWRALPAAAYTTAAPQPLPPIATWTNPNTTPLLNSSSPTDYSHQYIPEPWWGNNGGDPLHSIVLNYNPGAGGSTQHHVASSGLFGHADYAAFIASEVNNYITGGGTTLPRTNNWHFVKRARPIYRALFDTGNLTVFNIERRYFAHHLSIELAPWHTTGVTKDLINYMHANLRTLFDNSLLFAASESLRIENDKLNKKVIIRSSGTRIQQLLDNLRDNHISDHTIISFAGINVLECGGGRCLRFTLHEVNRRLNAEVIFLCIWGVTSRNDFPSRPDLADIFRDITITP